MSAPGTDIIIPLGICSADRLSAECTGPFGRPSPANTVAATLLMKRGPYLHAVSSFFNSGCVPS